jgi:hypothetical protein
MKELTLKNDEGLRNVSPSDCHNIRHNNIKNNISNSINNKINDGAGAANAAPPKEYIEMAFEYRNQREKWGEFLSLLEKWVNDTMNGFEFYKDSPEYKEKKEELVAIANKCLSIMYGKTNSF